MNNQLKLLVYIVFLAGTFMYIQNSYDLFDVSLIDIADTKGSEDEKKEEVVVEKKAGQSYVEVSSQYSEPIRVNVEVAENEATRARGLSNRRYLGDYDGMLFLFDEKSNKPFWMKDMYISIDIIFVDEDGFIVDIKEDNEPCTDVYCPDIYPSKLYKYVLEVNAGFAKEHRVQIGDRIEIHLSANR